MGSKKKDVRYDTCYVKAMCNMSNIQYEEAPNSLLRNVCRVLAFTQEELIAGVSIANRHDHFSRTMLCVCAVVAMSPGGVCTVGGSKGEDKCKTYYTGSHGSHLSPADVCGLLSWCHVPLFQHQETISPKQLPACLLPLQLFVSESTHLILYSYL